MVFANVCVFARAGNVDLIFGERSGRDIVERISAVRLYLRIVGGIMQHEEVYPAVAGYSIDNLINRFSGLNFNLTRHDIADLTKYEHRISPCRPATADPARRSHGAHTLV